MFNSIVYLLFFLFPRTLFSYSCLSSSDPLVRCTTQGLIRGLRTDFFVNTSNLTTISLEPQSVYAYLGVPYGEPPLGQQRFRKPVPKRAWSRGMIYNATKLPNSCYQMLINNFNASGEKIWAPLTPLSEDCLYLNIWIPITARQQPPLAVMVWIYGGGFTSGSVSIEAFSSRISYSIDLNKL